MTISWVKIPNAINYELYWSKDGGLKYEKLFILQENSQFEAQTVSGVNAYYFKVRASNSCQLFSVYSKPLYITYQSVPKAVTTVSTKVDECSL